MPLTTPQVVTEAALSSGAETNLVDATNSEFVETKWAHSAEGLSTIHEFDTTSAGATRALASNEDASMAAERSTLPWSAYW